MARGSSQPSAAAAVHAAAIRRGFGDHVQSVATHRSGGCWSAVCGLALGGVGVGAVRDAIPRFWALDTRLWALELTFVSIELGIGCILAAAAGTMIDSVVIPSIKVEGPRVDLYEYGLVIFIKGGVSTYAWSELNAVSTRQATDPPHDTSDHKATYRLEVRTRGGGRVVVAFPEHGPVRVTDAYDAHLDVDLTPAAVFHFIQDRSRYSDEKHDVT